MRLIDTHTGELKEYIGSVIPPYVAISHRWTDDEILFKDYIKGRRKDSLGYKKILGFREVGRSHDVDLVWIDTVCIDKTSSSELSEAINSMYKWYETALECYAYLSDVDASKEHWRQQFRPSVWFTRGWTLQELVAPDVVRFFTSNWTEMGICGSIAKPLKDFTPLVSEITSIPVNILLDPVHVRSESVAERIRWLGNRTTTRPEDIAYCAMGLLGINMPLLYGEGSRAWYRLQAEVIRTTNDESIFAWIRPTVPTQGYEIHDTMPILAPSAAGFVDGGLRRRKQPSRSRLPYAITNQGLELRLKPWEALQVAIRDQGQEEKEGSKAPGTVLVVPLNCCLEEDYIDSMVIILLRQPCGHFDRIVTPKAYTEAELGHRLRMNLHEETLYVHTTEEMQHQCYDEEYAYYRRMAGRTGAPEWRTSSDFYDRMADTASYRQEEHVGSTVA